MALAIFLAFGLSGAALGAVDGGSAGFRPIPTPVTGPGGATWSEEGDPPLEWLIPYYDAVSEGTIRPAPDAGPDTDPQDFFSLDVEAFNARTGAEDFATASRAYYGSLKFDAKHQKHEEPYYYMLPWRLLFHPPIKKLTLPMHHYLSEFTPADRSVEEGSRFFDPAMQWDVDFATETEMTYGNELELRPNRTSYAERLRMLREAKKSFFGVVMFYTCDTTGMEFVKELIRRKKEGIDVRMMVEGLYALTINRVCINEMIKGGVDVIRVSDFWKPAYFATVIHNKFWIKDSEEAVIGGQNFHDFANTSDGFHLTRDTDVWIKRGPAVTDLEAEYIRLWERYRMGSNKKIDSYKTANARKIEAERFARVRGRLNYSNWLSDPDRRMNGVCRVMVQDRKAKRQAIAPLLVNFINASNKSVFMTTPSVDFDLSKKRGKLHWEDRIFDAFQKAAVERGTRVDIISNGLAGGMGDMTNFFEKFLDSDGIVDKALVRRLITSLGIKLSENGAKKDRAAMLRVETLPGARAWGYFQFIHAKTQIFDRVMSGVTSFNWDNHSSEHNHEAGIFCLDRKLRDQLEAQMTTDIVNSVPIVSSNGL